MACSTIPWHHADLCTVLQQVLQNLSLLLVVVNVSQLHLSLARGRQGSHNISTWPDQAGSAAHVRLDTSAHLAAAS